MFNYSISSNIKNFVVTDIKENDDAFLDDTLGMSFILELSKEEYQKFTNVHYKSHFLQSYEWGQFCKNIKKQIPHYVGMKNKEGELVATALLLEKKLPFGLSYMYSPRGFLIDYTNRVYVNIFTNFIKKYMKENNIIYVKVDPDIKYQDIDSDANKVLGGNNNYELYNYLLSLGYVHHGFNKLYDANQPRYTFRINLRNENNVCDIKNKFSNSFIKALKKSDYYDLVVDNEKIPSKFYDLIKYNGLKDGFNPKTEKYYKELTNIMKDNVKYFNIKIKPKELLIKIDKDLKEYEELLVKGLKRQCDIKDKIVRLTKDKELFSSINEEEVVICSLIVVYTNNRVWSFLQGNNELATKIGAVAKCYYEAINDAKKRDFDFFDLFGTVGDPNTSYMNLSRLHVFKKSFGDEYIEFIGEFDLINNKLLYKLLPLMLKIYRNFKKII